METTNQVLNEEVVETALTSMNNGWKVAAGIGAAGLVVSGTVFAYKKLIKPKLEERKARKQDEKDGFVHYELENEDKEVSKEKAKKAK